MKIGLLAAGVTPLELQGEHGSYVEMFVRLFSTAGYHFSYEKYNVFKGEFPADVGCCDAWLVTGSACGVYEDLPWMLRLKTLISEIYRQGRPLLGICFGHQIIAATFGGRVEKYAGGWNVGLQEYRVRAHPAFVRQAVDSFVLPAIHQDQVVAKPDNAEVFATSGSCRHAGLVYDRKIFTLQGHPEFTLDFERAIIELRRGQAIAEETARIGLQTLAAENPKVDIPLVTTWMADFLRQ